MRICIVVYVVVPTKTNENNETHFCIETIDNKKTYHRDKTKTKKKARTWRATKQLNTVSCRKLNGGKPCGLEKHFVPRFSNASETSVLFHNK